MIPKSLSFISTVLRSTFPLSKPYKLNFCTTYRCQSRCLTCNIWQMKPKGELELWEVQRLAENNRQLKWLQLTGGEPFLRTDISEIAQAFKGLYILSVPTNSLCSPDMVQAKMRSILELGIPKVALTVSLDGWRELHDRIRGIPGNYDRAIETYLKMKSLQNSFPNLFVCFGYTMSKYNQGMFGTTLRAMRWDIAGLTTDDFHINLAQTSDNYYTNSELDFTVTDRAAAASELRGILAARSPSMDAIRLMERAFTKGLVDFLETGRAPLGPRGLDASFFLDSYGNVYPSIMSARRILNIRETGYAIDWRSEEVRKARLEQEPPHWTSCEAYQSLLGRPYRLLM